MATIDTLRYWVQKVLPLVYDDSLSYYELLGKVVAKINEVIDTSNTTISNVSDVNSKIKELSSKVESLIDNLINVIVPWDSSKEYDIFSVVEYLGTNYIAIQDVPVGTMITNTEYWQPANTITEQINAIGVEVSETSSKITPTIHVFPNLSNDACYSSNCAFVYSRKTTFLMDAGDTRNWDYIEDMIDEELANGRLTNIDYIIISHYHLDHVQCLAQILDKVPHVNCKAYIPANPVPYGYDTGLGDTFANVSQVLENAGIDTTVVSTDITEIYDEYGRFELYNATPADWAYYQGISANYNNCCMVTLFKDNGIYNMYPADLEQYGQARLVEQHSIPKCQLLNAPHHGLSSFTEYSLAFKEAVSPDVLPVTTSSIKLKELNRAFAGVTPFEDSSDILSSAYDKMIIFTSPYGHYVDAGYRVHSMGDTNVQTNLYVDGNLTENGIGTEDKPFNSIYGAINAISNGRNHNYTIYVKALDNDGVYPSFYLRNIQSPVILQRWGDTIPNVAFIYVAWCASVIVNYFKFVGGTTRNSVYQCGAVVSSNYVYFNHCHFVDTNNTNLTSRLLSVENNADVTLNVCTFEKNTSFTHTCAGIGATLVGKVESGGNNVFLNVDRAYHITQMRLNIVNANDTLTNVQNYVFGNGNYTIPNSPGAAFIAKLQQTTGANAVSNVFYNGTDLCVMQGANVKTLTKT